MTHAAVQVQCGCARDVYRDPTGAVGAQRGAGGRRNQEVASRGGRKQKQKKQKEKRTPSQVTTHAQLALQTVTHPYCSQNFLNRYTSFRAVPAAHCAVPTHQRLTRGARYPPLTCSRSALANFLEDGASPLVPGFALPLCS